MNRNRFNLWFTALWLLLFSPAIQLQGQQFHSPPGDSCSYWYGFEGAYVNLETQQYADSTDVIAPETDFTWCSKYRSRFRQEISEDSLIVNGTLFAIECDNDSGVYLLHLSRNGLPVKTLELPVENPLSEVREYSYLMIPFNGSLILSQRDFYGTHYVICKYSTEGELLATDSIEHTHVDKQKNVHHYEPYLNISELTPDELIFSSSAFYAKKDKTVLLNLHEFSLKEYPFTSNDFIYDEAEEKIIGYLSGEDGKYKVRMLNGKRFSFKIQWGSESFSTLYDNGLLYVANYCYISTGSSLQCYDLNRRKLKWKADVAQVMAEHSEYRNEVTLTRYKNTLILHGDESNQSYLQFFEAETGKRTGTIGMLLSRDGNELKWNW